MGYSSLIAVQTIEIFEPHSEKFNSDSLNNEPILFINVKNESSLSSFHDHTQRHYTR